MAYIRNDFCDARRAEAGERIGGALVRSARALDRVREPFEARAKLLDWKSRERRVARAAIRDDAKTVRAADDGQRGGTTMGAALGTSRQVQHERSVEQPRRRTGC